MGSGVGGPNCAENDWPVQCLSARSALLLFELLGALLTTCERQT